MGRSALRVRTAICISLVGVLFAIKWRFSDDIGIVGDLVIPPLLAGMWTTPRRTALVSVLAIAAAMATGQIFDQWLATDHLLRVAVVVVASTLAIQTAILRERDFKTRRRLALISVAQSELDSAHGLEQCVTSFARAATHEFAEWCFVDLRMPNRRSMRVVCASREPVPNQSSDIRPRTEITSAAGAYASSGLRNGPMLMRDADPLLLGALFEQHPSKAFGSTEILIVPVQTPEFSATYFLVCRKPLPRWGEAELTQAGSLARAAVLAARSDQLIDQLGFAQQELRGSRDQIEAIVQGIVDGIAVQDEGGQMIYANDAAARLLGFETAGQMLGLHYSEIAARLEIRDDAGRPFDAKNLPSRRALAGDELPEQLLRYTIKETGRELWALVKATAIVGTGDSPAMAVSVIEDLTAHQRAESAQRFLAEASKALGESLDPDVALEAIASAAVPALADWCSVELLTPAGDLRPAALAHANPDLVEQLRAMREGQRSTVDSLGATDVVRTGEPALFEHLEPETWRRSIGVADDVVYPAELAAQSALIAPIIAHGSPIGAITMVITRPRARFTEYDMETALELGRRAGVAIDNATLHSERSHLLRTLQRSLVPAELPDVDGLDFAALFRPAETEAEVGGDFYDVFELPDGSYAAVIGDVCGKGPEAAALTALARYTIRTAAMTESSPQRILKTLNDAILGQVRDDRFCTAAFARFKEPVNGGAVEAEVVAAGHPLPIRLSDDGPSAVGAPGALLGVVSDPDLPLRSIALPIGSALVLYTDGLSGGQTTADTEFALELAHGISRSDPDTIARNLNDAALQVQTEPNRDDVAILVAMPRDMA
ncbi:MAG: SpoIIE family protein phosphatase [Solirubrobacterales bacterium]